MESVLAINQEKEEWREVSERLNAFAAQTAGMFVPEVDRALEAFGKLQLGTVAITPADRSDLLNDLTTAGNVAASLRAEIDQMNDDLGSVSEMGDEESLRLQTAMDRTSKLMTTLSNLLTKASDTAQAITQNIK